MSRDLPTREERIETAAHELAGAWDTIRGSDPDLAAAIVDLSPDLGRALDELTAEVEGADE